MKFGWSLYEDEGMWYEDKCKEARISDDKLAIDCLDQEGYTVVVTAVSKDGTRFQGEYKYPSKTYKDGRVNLIRYKSETGDIFSGTWEEDGSSRRGRWIITIHA